MATPIIIETADDPRLEAYRFLRERDLVGRQGRFVVEGDVVLRLMLSRSHFMLESVLLSKRRAAASPDLLTAVPEQTKLYIADDVVLEAVTGFAIHRGVLAIGRKGEEVSLESLLAGLPAQVLVTVAIGMANHDNMGGLFRNAAAFGADAVLLDATCCDPLYRKAIRVSVGAALVVPFVRRGSASTILAALQKAGFATFGLSPSGQLALSQVKPPARSALVLGAEGPGLPPDLMARMTILRIPMADNFDSLNVATASGIALNHFFRP